MGRFIWNLAAIISLLLFLASGFFLVRSHSVAEFVECCGGEAEVRVVSCEGEVCVWYALQADGVASGQGAQVGEWPWLPPRTMGEIFMRMKTYGPIDVYWGDPRLGITNNLMPSDLMIIVPFWFVMIVAAIVPSFWLWRAIAARRRVAEGHCTRCGYDLRGSAARCPECGMALASK